MAASFARQEVHCLRCKKRVRVRDWRCIGMITFGCVTFAECAKRLAKSEVLGIANLCTEAHFALELISSCIIGNCTEATGLEIETRH